MSLAKCELEAVLHELAKARPHGGWGNATWTKGVKEGLVRLGRSKGYKTCTSGLAKATGNTWGEWLYDVVWLKATGDFTVCDVPLVAEIEWGQHRGCMGRFSKAPNCTDQSPSVDH